MYHNRHIHTLTGGVVVLGGGGAASGGGGVRAGLHAYMCMCVCVRGVCVYRRRSYYNCS
jgi:hypothetical protein